MRTRKRILSAAMLFLLMAAAALHHVNAQQPQTQTAPLFSANAKYTNGVAPGYWVTKGSGLTLDVSGGNAFCSGAMVTYSAGTLTATASVTNYVYLNTASSCVPAIKTTTFTSSDIPIATVVAGSSTITSITDDRTPFFAGGSSFTAGGDLSGSSSSQTVVGFDGKPLDSSVGSPADQNALIYDAGLGKYKASSIGTVTLPTWLSVLPDAPPSSAGTVDDECNSNSLSGWTNLNLGSLTTAEGTGWCSLTLAGATGVNWRGIYKTMCAATCTVTAKVSFNTLSPNNFGNFGLILYDDISGKLEAINFQEGVSTNMGLASLNVSHWTAVNGSGSNVFAGNIVPNPMYFRVKRDATNITYYWSASGSDNSFRQIWQEGVTSFLTNGPRNVGFAIDNENSAMTLNLEFDWIRSH